MDNCTALNAGQQPDTDYDIKTEVVERFLRYIKIDTQSDEYSETFPSTLKQKNLAVILADELKKAGVAHVDYDEEYGYVYGKIPGNITNESDKGCTLGFISHMDTSPEVSGKDVKPQIIENYDGGDIILNKDKDIVLKTEDFPEIKNYKGQDVITTDGNTLLGADDKAGIAEIMTMAAYLCSHPQIKHGDIAIAFTPDEEVGAGMDHFDVKRFGADYAYTVDGGAIGELEYENFNAAAAKVIIKGRNVHPGEAKGKMKNAALIAVEFNEMLPKEQRPDNTSGYEGFFHLVHLNADVEEAYMEYIIRDHDRNKFEEKKKLMEAVSDELNEKYGAGSVKVELKDQYYNMKEKLADSMFLVENAAECMKDIGITPKIQPIRGGTDGARLSFMGVPCPNLCAGGHNFHGRYEYCCVQSMEKITRLIIKLTGMTFSK